MTIPRRAQQRLLGRLAVLYPVERPPIWVWRWLRSICITLQLTVRFAPFVTTTALNRETRTPFSIRFAAILIPGWS